MAVAIVIELTGVVLMVVSVAVEVAVVIVEVVPVVVVDVGHTVPHKFGQTTSA